MAKFFSLCGFLFLFQLSFLSPVQAEIIGFSSPCDKAQNSADVIACLDKKYKAAQDQLNEIYNTVAEQGDDETKSQMIETQRQWISYRDQECDLAQSYVENQSLKHIQKLSCLLSVTDARTLFLTSFVAAQEDVSSDKIYVSFPIWMNVVSEKHPDVFWQYGGRVSADLNCDGVEEQVMLGLKTIQNNPADAQDQNSNLSEPGFENVVAIVEVPKTGKPVSYVASIMMPDDKDGSGVCAHQMRYQQVELPKENQVQEVSISGENQTVAEQCRAALRFTAPNCVPVTLQWSGDVYTFFH